MFKIILWFYSKFSKNGLIKKKGKKGKKNNTRPKLTQNKHDKMESNLKMSVYWVERGLSGLLASFSLSIHTGSGASLHLHHILPNTGTLQSCLSFSTVPCNKYSQIHGIWQLRKQKAWTIIMWWASCHSFFHISLFLWKLSMTSRFSRMRHSNRDGRGGHSNRSLWACASCALLTHCFRLIVWSNHTFWKVIEQVPGQLTDSIY